MHGQSGQGARDWVGMDKRRSEGLRDAAKWGFYIHGSIVRRGGVIMCKCGGEKWRRENAGVFKEKKDCSYGTVDFWGAYSPR
jgi:hypothetical protein